MVFCRMPTGSSGHIPRPDVHFPERLQMHRGSVGVTSDTSGSFGENENPTFEFGIVILDHVGMARIVSSCFFHSTAPLITFAAKIDYLSAATS